MIGLQTIHYEVVIEMWRHTNAHLLGKSWLTFGGSPLTVGETTELSLLWAEAAELELRVGCRMLVLWLWLDIDDDDDDVRWFELPTCDKDTCPSIWNFLKKTLKLRKSSVTVSLSYN